MAVVTTAKLGQFDGLNNRLRPTSLGHRTPNNAPATYLSKADNVDIGEDRVIRRRSGMELAIPGKAHSLWADRDGAFAVVDGQLLSLSQNLTPTVLRTGMPSARVSYSRGADGAVYWTNGAVLRKVQQGADRPVAERQPGQPGVSVGAGGLRSGRYLVSVTVDGPAGESAPSEPLVAVVPDGGALSISAPLEAGQKLRVYVSGPNGDVLTAAGESTSGTVTVPVYQGDGRILSTRVGPMPSGQLLARFDARLVVASENVVWFSRPWHYGVTDPVSDYIPFPSRVTMVLPSRAGLFIAADKTYLLAQVGGEMREVLPFGSVEGAAGTNPEDGTVFWHTERGLAIANAAGEVGLVQNDVLMFPEAKNGSVLWREREGSRHILASTGGERAAIGATMKFQVKD